jgi:hypothetical protein
LASFMRVLLVVGGDANDQNLLQRAPFYNAFLRTYTGLGGEEFCFGTVVNGIAHSCALSALEYGTSAAWLPPNSGR